LKKPDILLKLEFILSEITEYSNKCKKGVLKQSQAQEYIKSIDDQLNQYLGHSSDAFKIYDRMSKERTLKWTEHFSDYVYKSDCEHFDYYKDILDNVIKEYEPSFKIKEKNELFFSKNQVYEATKSLIRIMKSATNNLTIIDPCLDSEVFDYIDEIDGAIIVRFLTKSKKQMFNKLYTSLKIDRTNIEARVCDKVHDRFLIIDNFKYWYMGASINSIGKKAFMMKKVENYDAIDKLKTDFEDCWNNGTIL
jgi:hypothetical protein